MGDVKKQMEDIIRQESGDIREKSASESLRATAADTKRDTSNGEGASEREIGRERESVEAERSGDIGGQTESPMTEEERRRAVREKQNRNLRTTAQMTETERREFASIGGQASAKARRKKKDLQDMLGTLLATPATPEMLEKASALGIDAKDANTLYDALCVALFGKALSGDAYAFQLIRDSAGDKPTDRSETSVSIMTDKDKEVMAAIERRMRAEKSATDGQKPE